MRSSQGWHGRRFDVHRLVSGEWERRFARVRMEEVESFRGTLGADDGEAVG